MVPVITEMSTVIVIVKIQQDYKLLSNQRLPCTRMHVYLNMTKDEKDSYFQFIVGICKDTHKAINSSING